VTVEELNKLSSKLLKSFNSDDIVEIEGDTAVVYHENPVTGASKVEIDIYSLVDDEDVEDNTGIDQKPDSICWDGISKVRAWSGAGKQRIYMNVVGVPASAHAKGRVFLELIHGEWVPNMKYRLMQELANSLNAVNIKDAEKVQQLYQEYIQNY
jgi:hypothetical protein